MKTIKVAFIGTGRPWQTAGATGFGMAYAHAEGYRKIRGVEIVACADLVAANAEAFAEKYGARGVYTDYGKMLRAEKPHIVSICTWPHLHSPMVIATAKAGVKGIHCEKPMAEAWGPAKKMAAACKKRGVKLTFNHQRRFGAPFVKLAQIARSGKLGKLWRMEAYASNFYDWGTHWLDMLNKFNGEVPAVSVIGQLHWTGGRVFGAPCEREGVYHVRYKNGVETIFVAGGNRPDRVCLRVSGAKGVAELRWEAPVLRMWTRGRRDFATVPVPEELHGGIVQERAIASVVKAVREGGKSELCAENALRSTEVIFAGYESARRRCRIDLPLKIDDNPLEALIKSGAVKAQPKPKTHPKK